MNKVIQLLAQHPIVGTATVVPDADSPTERYLLVTHLDVPGRHDIVQIPLPTSDDQLDLQRTWCDARTVLLSHISEHDLDDASGARHRYTSIEITDEFGSNLWVTVDGIVTR